MSRAGTLRRSGDLRQLAPRRRKRPKLRRLPAGDGGPHLGSSVSRRLMYATGHPAFAGQRNRVSSVSLPATIMGAGDRETRCAPALTGASDAIANRAQHVVPQ